MSAAEIADAHRVRVVPRSSPVASRREVLRLAVEYEQRLGTVGRDYYDPVKAKPASIEYGYFLCGKLAEGTDPAVLTSRGTVFIREEKQVSSTRLLSSCVPSMATDVRIRPGDASLPSSRSGTARRVSVRGHPSRVKAPSASLTRCRCAATLDPGASVAPWAAAALGAGGSLPWGRAAYCHLWPGLNADPGRSMRVTPEPPAAMSC